MTPTDPLYILQWHFALIGDIETIWDDYDGSGVSVVVYDSAVDTIHKDLVGNYNDIRFTDSLGTEFNPALLGSTNLHGTAVAGLIAAEDDGVGTVGIAHGATLTGLNFTGDLVGGEPDDTPQETQARIIDALEWAANFDVMNNSWGIAPNEDRDEDGDPELVVYDQASMQVGGEIYEWVQAYEYISENGRGGLGTIIVQSAGNGATWGDGFQAGAINANSDGLNSSRYTITVSATDQTGLAEGYSNWGTSILVAAPGGNQNTGTGSVTTDLTGPAGGNGFADPDYTDQFGGTSTAAPIVSGTVTLMLEANPDLGWRDVQNILSMSASQTGSAYGSGGLPPEKSTWGANDADTWNGGGATYNLSYGYGMVDVYAAVRMAETWSLFYDAPMTSGLAGNEVSTFADYTGADVIIPEVGSTTDLDPDSLTITVTENIMIETAYLTVDVTHDWGGDLVMWLISPDGEETPFYIYESGEYNYPELDAKGNPFDIFNPNPPNDPRMENGFQWTFEIDVLRGSSSLGDWQLRIDDTEVEDAGYVSGFSMEFFGSPATNDDVYHFTDDFLLVKAVDAERAVINGDGVDENDDNTIDASIDWMNLVAVTGDVTLDLSSDTAPNLSVDGIDWATIVVGSMENVASGDGDDTIIGDEVTNHIHGGRGNDVLTSLGGEDIVFGERGDDTLEGGLGADSLDGGDGIDTASYADSNQGVDIGFAGFASVGAGGTAEGDQLSNMEVIVGSNFSDFLLANGTGTTVDGGAGPDTLRDRDGVGGATMLGGSGRDTLLGRDGDDSLYGGDQNDFLQGGEDQDALFGEDGNDRLRGDGGDDFMSGGLGIDNLIGGLGNDTLEGNEGRDLLFGQEGDDSLVGGADQDFMNGGADNDTLVGGEQTDRLYGEDGNDVLRGDGLNSGRDFLFGGADADMIYSAHNDDIEGGLGADTFIFATDFERGTIRDFENGIDQIDLTAVTEVADFDDLVFRQITETRARIDFNDLAGDHLVLQNTVITDLDETDFVFNVV